MGRMSELDAEIRQNADQQEETKTVTSSLMEAAQFVIDTVDIHGVYRPEIFEAFERLRDALAGEPKIGELEAAVLAEREACARLVENYAGAWDDEGFALAQEIRARGQEPVELVPSNIMSSHKKVL